MEINTRQVCEDLVSLVGRVKMAMFRVAESYGLTPVQLFALYAIFHGNTTMGRVAERLHCDASNVTGIVDRLVNQKLVVRSENETDRRTKTLELTAKGREIIQNITDGLPETLGCEKLSATEREALHTATSKLAG